MMARKTTRRQGEAGEETGSGKGAEAKVRARAPVSAWAAPSPLRRARPGRPPEEGCCTPELRSGQVGG